MNAWCFLQNFYTVPEDYVECGSVITMTWFNLLPFDWSNWNSIF